MTHTHNFDSRPRPEARIERTWDGENGNTAVTIAIDEPDSDAVKWMLDAFVVLVREER